MEISRLTFSLETISRAQLNHREKVRLCCGHCSFFSFVTHFDKREACNMAQPIQNIKTVQPHCGPDVESLSYTVF